MSGAILSLFGVVLAAAIGDLLIPGEEKGGTRQLLHFLTALSVLFLLLSPFRVFLQSADGFLQGEIEWGEAAVQRADFEQMLAEAVASRSAVQLREGLASLLEQEYGICAEDREIEVELGEQGELRRIAVRLKGAALLQDPEQIRADLLERFLCDDGIRSREHA